jgi:short-subunit dehydrogenase
MTSFTDAIRIECKGSGVEVQTLNPWYVKKDVASIASSELQAKEGGTLCVPTAELYAKHAVATLGVANKTAGYWPHGLQVTLFFEVTVNLKLRWFHFYRIWAGRCWAIACGRIA